MKKRLQGLLAGLGILALVCAIGSPLMAQATAVSSKFVSGNLVFYDKSGNEIYTIDGANRKLSIPAGSTLALAPGAVVPSAGSAEYNIRSRFTIAQINTGATILSAVTGYKYRLISARAIAYGGAVGATTTVDILGTQTTAVKLVAYAQASLTQSAVLTAGGTGAAVLADGASFVQNDVSTAITIGKTGSDLTTATGVDVILTYAVEL